MTKIKEHKSRPYRIIQQKLWRNSVKHVKFIKLYSICDIIATALYKRFLYRRCWRAFRFLIRKCYLRSLLKKRLSKVSTQTPRIFPRKGRISKRNHFFLYRSIRKRKNRKIRLFNGRTFLCKRYVRRLRRAGFVSAAYRRHVNISRSSTLLLFVFKLALLKIKQRNPLLFKLVCKKYPLFRRAFLLNLFSPTSIRNLVSYLASLRKKKIKKELHEKRFRQLMKPAPKYDERAHMRYIFETSRLVKLARKVTVLRGIRRMIKVYKNKRLLYLRKKSKRAQKKFFLQRVRKQLFLISEISALPTKGYLWQFPRSPESGQKRYYPYVSHSKRKKSNISFAKSKKSFISSLINKSSLLVPKYLERTQPLQLRRKIYFFRRWYERLYFFLKRLYLFLLRRRVSLGASKVSRLLSISHKVAKLLFIYRKILHRYQLLFLRRRHLSRKVEPSLIKIRSLKHAFKKVSMFNRNRFLFFFNRFIRYYQYSLTKRKRIIHYLRRRKFHYSHFHKKALYRDLLHILCPQRVSRKRKRESLYYRKLKLSKIMRILYGFKSASQFYKFAQVLKRKIPFFFYLIFQLNSSFSSVFFGSFIFSSFRSFLQNSLQQGIYFYLNGSMRHDLNGFFQVGDHVHFPKASGFTDSIRNLYWNQILGNDFYLNANWKLFSSLLSCFCKTDLFAFFRQLKRTLIQVRFPNSLFYKLRKGTRFFNRAKVLSLVRLFKQKKDLLSLGSFAGRAVFRDFKTFLIKSLKAFGLTQRSFVSRVSLNVLKRDNFYMSFSTAYYAASILLWNDFLYKTSLLLFEKISHHRLNRSYFGDSFKEVSQLLLEQFQLQMRCSSFFFKFSRFTFVWSRCFNLIKNFKSLDIKEFRNAFYLRGLYSTPIRGGNSSTSKKTVGSYLNIVPRTLKSSNSVYILKPSGATFRLYIFCKRLGFTKHFLHKRKLIRHYKIGKRLFSLVPRKNVRHFSREIIGRLLFKYKLRNRLSRVKSRLRDGKCSFFSRKVSRSSSKGKHNQKNFNHNKPVYVKYKLAYRAIRNRHFLSFKVTPYISKFLRTKRSLRWLFLFTRKVGVSPNYLIGKYPSLVLYNKNSIFQWDSTDFILYKSKKFLLRRIFFDYFGVFQALNNTGLVSLVTRTKFLSKKYR